jgi:uncharacterized protein (DUF342 family)
MSDNKANLGTIDEEKPKYKIDHLISANKLKAYIRIELTNEDAVVGSGEIFDYLGELGIKYGINIDIIKDYCIKKEYSKELLAAEGKCPVNGRDAEIVYNFDLTKENKFIEKEDGSIDFQNLNNITNVKKDDILCRMIPAEKGTDGINVFGNAIQYREGRNISFENGKNTYISDDGLELRAGSDGCVKVSGGTVFVDDVYRVNNVDNGTGNITFNGSVIIGGDVKAGFSVRAIGDIKIRGMVEGAFIESGGDVVISKGKSGIGKGTIRAKGSITSKYIENSIIESEKNVYAEALINSFVTAKESIMLRGNTAAIIGGTIAANNIIYAKTIGNKTNTETNIVIDIKDYLEEQKLMIKKAAERANLEGELSSKQKELKDIEEKINMISGESFTAENRNILKKHFIFKKITLNNQINEIKKQLIEHVPSDDIANHKVICKGIIYANTKITIGWMKYKVREDISYSKIYNDGNDIAVVTLNPSDIQ